MISAVFNELFNCFSIHIIILNEKIETIFQHKVSDNIKNSFYLSKALNHLKVNSFSEGKNHIHINSHVKYTCIMFYHYDNSPIYILLGPYRLQTSSLTIKENNTDSDILLIAEDWIDNIIKVYYYIIDNHICLNKNNTSSSPCVNHAIEYIKNNYTNDISIDKICEELNINKCYFCSIFKKETGSTFINYLNNYKIEKSKELLKNTNLSLLDISLSVGFNNQSYYSTIFKKLTGKRPLEFRDEY